MNHHHHTNDPAYHLAGDLDALIPPGQTTLPAYDLPDPALDVARHLAAAEHPIMAADRVEQLEAQILARAALQRQTESRRRIMRAARWVAAACVLIVFALALATGAALVLNEGDTHILTPDTSAYESTDPESPDTIQPITIHESRESSVFIIPPGP